MFGIVPLAIVLGTTMTVWTATADDTPDRVENVLVGEKKPAEAAKEAAKTFMQAMRVEDIDAVMKVVGVPFYWDGRENIDDRDALRKAFVGVFDEKDLTRIEFEVADEQAFADLPLHDGLIPTTTRRSGVGKHAVPQESESGAGT